MTVTQVRQALGSWNITLKPTTPRELLDALTFYGHVAILDGRVNVPAYGDGLLPVARYVGVYRERSVVVDNRSSGQGYYRLGGVGMALWLGDETGGDLYEDAVELSNATFANAIRALLPPGGAVTEGTLHSVPGTYTGRHQFQTPRTAITYVCETFGAEWRVNNDATLDAGTVEDLYGSEPTAVLVSRGHGRDLGLVGYQGRIDSSEDVEGWTSRVVLLAEGAGLSIVTGTANVDANPYRDLHGNPVRMTRLVSESATVPVNATTRAHLALSEANAPRRSLRLSTSDYVLQGDLVVGGWVWVYSPDSGLVGGEEITFRGQRIHPVRMRCSEVTWPVVEGMTVAYRAPDGTWWDLTDHVQWESGDTTVTVGEMPRSLTGAGVEPVGTRPAVDTTIPGVPQWVTPFESQHYLDSSGQTRSRVLLRWNAPLNTDGSTILDGDHYEIRYRVDTDVLYPQTWAALANRTWNQLQTWNRPIAPTTTSWQTVYVPWGESTCMLQDLTNGVGYDVQIRLVDSSGNAGAWSPEFTFVTNADSLPPSTPAPPQVAGSRIALQVTHELRRASGGFLESDLDHLEIHVDYEPHFVPSEATLKGKVRANAGMMQAQVPAVITVPVEETSTRYVRVVAVDEAGNKSLPSAAAAATALLIDDAHISDLTVSKVTAGTISSDWLIGASIRTAVNGARVELNSSGLQAYNAGGMRTVDIRASDGSVSIIGQLSSGTSGDRIVINPSGTSVPLVRFYPTTGSNFAAIHSSARDNEPSEVELFITASRNAENTARSQLSVKSGTIYAYVMDQNLGNNRGGTLDLNEDTSAGVYTVQLANRTGNRALNGAVFRGGRSSAEVGFRNGTSNDNYFVFSGDATTYHIGEWDDFVNRDANQGLFTGSVSNLTSNGDSASISYGTTKSSMMLPIVAIRDNPSVANTRGFAVTANSTSSFTVQLSGPADGVWAIYFWAFRI